MTKNYFSHVGKLKAGITFCVLVLLAIDMMAGNALVRRQVPFFMQKEKPVGVRQFSEIETTKSKAPTAIPLARYAYPGIVAFDGPGCYISFSQHRNKIDSLYDPKKPYILYPKEQEITYYDMSENTPTSYQWYAPGAAETSAETQDLVTSYLHNGLYDFPTLKAINADGENTYQAAYRLQIGDTAEICGFNSHSPKTSKNPSGTYEPVYWKWNDGGGYMTGTNKKGVNAFGAQIQLGQQESELLEINVYLKKYPLVYDANAMLKLIIWEMGLDGQGYFQPNKFKQDSVMVKFSDIMPVATSITGLRYKSGDDIMGMVKFKLPKPMRVPIDFFVSIEGFGNKYETGDDFCILMNDLDPAEGEGFFNAAGNCKSWFRLDENGSQSWYPLGVMFDFNQDNFYEFNPVLMICPVVNYNVVASALSQTRTASVSIEKHSNGFVLQNVSGKQAYRIYNMAGQLVQQGNIESDHHYIPFAKRGVFVLRVAGESLKFIQ
jgi:hypothetical protein